MSANEITWTCSVCDKIHRGLPAIAFKAPTHYHGIPEEERAERTTLNEDFCVIGTGRSFTLTHLKTTRSSQT